MTPGVPAGDGWKSQILAHGEDIQPQHNTMVIIFDLVLVIHRLLGMRFHNNIEETYDLLYASELSRSTCVQTRFPHKTLKAIHNPKTNSPVEIVIIAPAPSSLPS